MELPVCRWRGPDVAPGRCACNSPKLIVGPNGVNHESCLSCYCRDHPPVEVPGLLRKAINFTKAAVQHICTGMKKLPDDHAKARLTICEGCSLYNIHTQSCQLCGCNMPLKVTWAEQRCPHPDGDRWAAVDESFRHATEEKAVNPDARKIVLHNPLSPGDILVMTAALECLHKQFPGQFLTDVDSPCPAIYQHNPHVTTLDRKEAEILKVEYPLIDQCNQQPVHFLQGYVDFLADKLQIPLRLTTNRPYLYLFDEEKAWMSQVQEITGKPTKFWIVNAGTKHDFTAKGWSHANYQKVVDHFRGKIIFVQVGEKHHNHKPLDGVIDLIGKTDTRQLIRLCWHAQGGLGPTTFVQHIFAAFEKPYVCLLGAREPVSWTHYPAQRTLSTQGALDCCKTTACWRSRVVKLNDNQPSDNSLCEYPIPGQEPVARCMQLIRPSEVIATIESFYAGGVLSY